MAILFSDFIYKSRCNYAIFHTPIFNRIIHMNNVNPQLPPLLVKKTGNVFYVYTYQAEWIPKTFDENGNAIGGIATNNKRSMVGKILDGKNEGPIKFNDKFLKDYPEFRDYIVSRKGKGLYDIKHIDDFSTENAQDLEVMNTLVACKEYSINDSGKLVKSATAAPLRKASKKKSASKQDSKTQMNADLMSLSKQCTEIHDSYQALGNMVNANISSGKELTFENLELVCHKYCELHEKGTSLLETLKEREKEAQNTIDQYNELFNRIRQICATDKDSAFTKQILQILDKDAVD